MVSGVPKRPYLRNAGGYQNIKDLRKIKTLDLGLGHGYSAEVLCNWFDDYTIIEGDYRMIDRFMMSHSDYNIKIVHSYFEDYEPDERFDVIIMGFILEHVDDPEFLIKKYKMYLKQNGRLFIAVPNAEALNRRFGYEAGMLKDIRQLSDYDISVGHKRFYTMNTFSELALSTGMEIVNTDGLYLKPFTTKQIASLNFEKNIMDAMMTVGRIYPELCVAFMCECRVNG